MGIEQLYDEAFIQFKSDRILFRGFMLEKNDDGSVSFKDIRNTYYREVRQKDLKIILEMGFYAGTTYLLMESDKRKIRRYEELIEYKARLLEDTENPRKQREHLNTINRYEQELNYYRTQVSRWLNN